jgi:hypothetical protein
MDWAIDHEMNWHIEHDIFEEIYHKRTASWSDHRHVAAVLVLVGYIILWLRACSALPSRPTSRKSTW